MKTMKSTRKNSWRPTIFEPVTTGIEIKHANTVNVAMTTINIHPIADPREPRPDNEIMQEAKEQKSNCCWPFNLCFK